MHDYFIYISDTSKKNKKKSKKPVNGNKKGVDLHHVLEIVQERLEQAKADKVSFCISAHMYVYGDLFHVIVDILMQRGSVSPKSCNEMTCSD